MKKNKYMAEITINNSVSYFTYTSQNMKTAKKELEDFFMTTQNTKIKVCFRFPNYTHCRSGYHYLFVIKLLEHIKSRLFCRDFIML